MKPSRGLTPARRPPVQNSTEEVAVYCRIRPLENDNEESCIRVVDEKTVQLSPPESSRAFLTWGFNEKEMRYAFRKVFDPEASQKIIFDQVGLPLVKDLLNDKNGLLFTYGVTGSGKTHTMQGTPQDGGLLSRVIDVVFNSMKRQVSRRRLIIPDRFNGFQVQDVSAAVLAEHSEMVRSRQTPRSKLYGMNGGNLSDPNLSDRLPDTSKIENIDQSSVYAVFISYVEIYNNYIYDLLETDARDIITGKPKFTSRTLREDPFGNIFVVGCNEVNVMSPKEALEVFYKGQKRRRVAQTQLNHESSRSHSVFTIRIVKATPGQGEEIDLSKPCTVSQLSLVDLAGSERTSRTGNTGNRLREAGNINNSLMTLRSCIEKLRENQKTNKSGAVPYRNSKITHLFRNFFEGQGAVRMIVCINPRAADFDETVNVLQFAELTQEVQIERRPDANAPREFGLTPGQKRANEIYREALRRVPEEIAITPIATVTPIYSLGPAWPSLDLLDDEAGLDQWERFLEKRISTRNTLLEDHEKQQMEFRSVLVEREKEVILQKEEIAHLRAMSDNDKKMIKELEDRLVNAVAANDSLQRRVYASKQAKAVLENELDEKELLINQHKLDTKKVTKKLKAQVTQQELVSCELAAKLKQRELQREAENRDMAKLRAVKAIVTDNHRVFDDGHESMDIDDIDLNRRSLGTAKSQLDIKDVHVAVEVGRVSGRRSAAVANPRYRRSQSTGAERWVDHHSENEVPLNTILKPVLRNPKRSVTKLTEKDLFNEKTAKYCLTTQEQDTDGEVETKVYKGDVIETAGGGRQVIFNDVEILRQTSPERLPSPGRRSRSPRKRSYDEYRSVKVGSRIAELEDRLANHGGSKTKKYY